MKYLFLSLFFLAAACVNNGKPKEKTAPLAASVNSAADTGSSRPEFSPLPQDDLAGGVVGLKEDANGLLYLYNRNGSIWKTVDLAQDSIVDATLNPHSIKLDYNNLVFRCVREVGSYYAVIADENTGLIKYVKKDDPHFEYQPWEQHLLHVFSVGFDEKKNPLRRSQDPRSASIPFDKEAYYHPVEIKGDWMKVEIENDSMNVERGGKRPATGWIKWKEGHKIIVDVFYVA